MESQNKHGEKWRAIPGYEGLYEASNHGRIKSLARFVKCGGGIRLVKERILKVHLGTTGYFHVRLYGNGSNKLQQVHRQIAKTWTKNPGGKNQVNHIDGDKTNNHAENLEWVTAKENTEHAISKGLRDPAKNPKRKLTRNKVVEIKTLLGKHTYAEIAKKYGVGYKTIAEISRGVAWAHVKVLKKSPKQLSLFDTLQTTKENNAI